MRLPAACHEANTAGLAATSARHAAKTARADAARRAAHDNQPTAEFVVARIRELEGDLPAQEALFYALPDALREQVMDALCAPHLAADH